MIVSEREAAYRVLEKTVFSGSFLKDAMEEISRLPQYETVMREKYGAVLSLSKGAVERLVTIEAILSRLSSVAVRKMDRTVRIALLLGAYELLYTDTEDYAAVNESVSLVKKLGKPQFSGFANGVLRAVARRGKEIEKTLTDREKLSLPEPLFDALAEWLGRENAVLCGAYFLSPESKRLTIRRNESKATEEELLRALKADGCTAIPTHLSETTYELSGGKPVGEMRAYKDALFYVQDASSALSGDALSDLFTRSAKLRVLDAASSPGGKTIHLADLAAKRGTDCDFLACDVSEEKRRRIEENAARFGGGNVRTEVRDGTVFDPALESAYDLVLCDVPCSGIGVLSKKPDIKLHFSRESVESLLPIQRAILGVNSRYVRTGGTLLYSTCTLNPEENTENVKAFLSAHPEFRLVSEKQFLPHVDHTDGFYYARLLKTGEGTQS